LRRSKAGCDSHVARNRLKHNNWKGLIVPEENYKSKQDKSEPQNQDSTGDGEHSAEANALAAESAKADAELGKLASDLNELRQTLLRRQADFENYRKRIEKERAEDSRRATARVIEGFIPVIDGFEQALAVHRDAAYEQYRKGFELIYKQLLDNITRLGAERIDPVGKPFDPHLHQAMDRTVTAEHEDGTVLQVFQPGYMFHGRVLRPAMVRVAVHPSPASKEAVN
jgi:molecular chaperone GrpE